MTRSVMTYVLCIVGLSLGGCYKHSTVAESDISPIEAEDGGVDLPGENGGDNGGDTDNGGDSENGGDNEGNGGDNEGENGTDEPGEEGPFGDLDCEDPPDELTKFLCGLQDGGDNSGQGGGGFPGGSGGGRPGGTPGGGFPGTPGGGGMGPGGGFPGAGGGDPGEIIQEIIDNLDCDQKEPDFITQILCSLTEGGGGFPGGGFPGGGASR